MVTSPTTEDTMTVGCNGMAKLIRGTDNSPNPNPATALMIDDKKTAANTTRYWPTL